LKVILPVILAGGSGTRLWPLSRKLYPKQFLPLVTGRTLFQETVLRLNGGSLAAPIVVGNDEHRFMIAEQLREIEREGCRIVLEPVGRNTAPAACVAAEIALREVEDPLLLILPADHHIADTAALLSVVEQGAELARQGNLVTFGVVPSAPETGYGYIKRGKELTGNAVEAFAIDRFVEKPDQTTAQKYLEAGGYYWNSGMFLFSAAAYREELTRHNPAMAEACGLALDKGGKDLDFYRLDEQAFKACPSDSIDYAVMEHTEKGVVVPFDAGWSDVGSWDAIWNVKDKTEDQNVAVGDVITEDVQGSYLHSSGRLLAVVGLRDHVVVETTDAVMVSPKDRVQDVKKLVDRLKAEDRPEALTHKKVYRPWGNYETIDLSERFQVKRITVKPGAKLSLQKHFHRAEHWIVVKGTAVVTRGEETLVLHEDQSTYIPLGHMHRIENPGKIELELIEVQTGSYLGEDDIVRFEDVYGREKAAKSDDN
jgi:mannose-1-phosphate guanylyltransferase/mannose-6-phosphate isomerase